MLLSSAVFKQNVLYRTSLLYVTVLPYNSHMNLSSLVNNSLYRLESSPRRKNDCWYSGEAATSWQVQHFPLPLKHLTESHPVKTCTPMREHLVQSPSEHQITFRSTILTVFLRAVWRCIMAAASIRCMFARRITATSLCLGSLSISSRDGLNVTACIKCNKLEC